MSRGRATLTVMTAVIVMLLNSAAPAHAAYSRTARAGTWVPNGVVYAIAVQGDRVYIGGSFTSVRNPSTGASVARSRLAAFDATTGALVTSFDAAASSTVRALAVSDDGGTVYAGGDFTSVNGSGRTRLAALDTDGDLVPGWNASASNSVRDLVVRGDALFVAGRFSTVNGTRRAGLARLNAGSGQVVSAWTSHVAEGRALALALSPDGSELVAGGTFRVIDGVRQPFLAAVSTTDGDITAWRPPALCDGCTLLDVTTAGTAVYAAVGGPGGRVGAWDADRNVLDWQRRADGDVQAVAYHEGVVYAGGHYGPWFSNATRHQLAALTASAGILLDFAPTFTGGDYPGVWALVAGPDYLRVGGGFRGLSTGPQARYAEFPYQ